MAGANLGLLVSNFFRHKRSVLFAIFLGTVIAIVLVASVGARSKGSSASRSLAAFVNWAQFGHQEDDAESRGDSRQEGEPDSQQQQPAFQVQASNHAGQGKVPHYLSPEERLKRIAATFRERNLGDENLCAAIKRGEIEVDRHKRRGGKKSAWIATWKGKKVVVKRNDFEVNVALNKNLFYAWDSNDNGRVERIEFFKSLANALERMGIYESELDTVFHTADVNRDGVLNIKEVLLGAAIVYERYNQKLAPEALLTGENPDLKIFPRYYGHCNNSYVVEFLPVHSLYMMRQREWKVRAKLALGLLDWAKTATEEGYFACDMILGNFGQGEDGVIKINDLDQVHSKDDVERWRNLPCTPGVKGVGCFDDGHCRMTCLPNGKCPVMPPHHNYREICRRLLWNRKKNAALIADRDRKDVYDVLKGCVNGKTPEQVMSAAERLVKVLEMHAEGVTQADIAPPDFEGQVRFGKKLDYLSKEIEAAKQEPGSTMVPKDFKQLLPWEF